MKVLDVNSVPQSERIYLLPPVMEYTFLRYAFMTVSALLSEIGTMNKNPVSKHIHVRHQVAPLLVVSNGPIRSIAMYEKGNFGIVFEKST